MASFIEHLGSLLPRRTVVPEATKSAGALFAIEGLARPVWSSRDYASYAREGMMRNAVAYRCIRMIAEAAASVKLTASHTASGGLEPVAEHGLLDLLRRPAPGLTTADLFERWYGTLLVSGNVYLNAVAAGGEVRELHLLRPDRVSIVPGRDGWPAGVEYTIDGRRTVLDGEVMPGVSQVLHVKLFHPADDHYGLSPVEAASNAIDIHNTATLWNKALLDNAARPSGALVYSAGGNLSGEQFDRLKEELETSFQGARNAGRPMLLEGGLDWKSMSLSPRDMDFIEAKNAAARLLQLAVAKQDTEIEIDGEIGPLTLAAVNDADETKLLADYADARRKKYRSLHHFWKFGRGWLNRVNRTEQRARTYVGWAAPKSNSKTEKGNDMTISPTGKWWGSSMTIWGAAITALSTVLPILGPAIGVDVTPDVVRQAGEQFIAVIQAIGGLVGTIMAIYGRARATQKLERRHMQVHI